MLAALMVYGVFKSISEKYDTLEPFAVENYEITDEGLLKIYFNRELQKDEDIALSVYIANNENKGERASIPIDNDTKAQIFNYDSNKKDTVNVAFNQLIKNHVAKVDTVSASAFKLANGNSNETTFIDGKIWFLWQHFQNYKSSDQQPIEEVNRHTLDMEMWSRSLLQFSKGTFDDKGQKQGKWKWYFSNGSVLAEATFKDDIVSDSLSIYKFNEKMD